MAAGDLLRKLFKSFAQDKREDFLNAANEIIQEEHRKNHTLLAKDLEKILLNNTGKNGSIRPSPWHEIFDVPKDKESGIPLVDIKFYQLAWEDLVLSDQNSQSLMQIVLEQKKKNILKSHGLIPKSKILFCGPPGCGKTIAAKVLSSQLDYALIYVSLPTVVSSFLGETATNLKKIFDFAKKGQWVIFFDEFDALARDRNSENEHGEMKRLVNSILQLIDNSENDSILVAATNYETLLDRAIWRRFDEVLYFGKPNYSERLRLYQKHLISVLYNPIHVEKISRLSKGATGSDIEKICTDAITFCLLSGRDDLRKSDFDYAFNRYQMRLSIMSGNSAETGNYVDD
jgi:SpoVK/Ycf46/Vps4 family AAA+-type ATPase